MIIVTGGAGFIGSNLVAALEESSDQPIIVCDRLRSNEKWQNLCKRKPLEIIHPDALFSFLDDHTQDIEIIYHMGAISTTTERDADLILENNIHLSLNLFYWCTQNKTRFIYASSAATYGDGNQGFRDDWSSNYLKKFRPLNAYAWSKHWVDRQIASWIEEGGDTPSQWAGLKFFNVYGPNEYHKGAQQSVASHLFRTIYKEKQPARLFKSYKAPYPDGGQQRDFIWVRDCIDVLLWLKDTPSVKGIFNVGTGKARSFMDLATALYDALEQKPAIDFIDMPEGLPEKYQYFTEATSENLKKAGYTKGFTPLEDGVRQYVQHYLKTDDPYV